MRGLLLNLLFGSIGLSACQPLYEEWISPSREKSALCKSVGENIARNNIELRSTFVDPKRPPSFDDLQDKAVMPGGKIYIEMISNLSDAELMGAINIHEVTQSYVYEYAERLYRRGEFDKSLALAFSGTISPSPRKYKISYDNFQYSKQTVNQYGGYIPSDCLATEICKGEIAERPLYWGNCKAMRFKNVKR